MKVLAFALLVALTGLVDVGGQRDEEVWNDGVSHLTQLMADNECMDESVHLCDQSRAWLAVGGSLVMAVSADTPNLTYNKTSWKLL